LPILSWLAGWLVRWRAAAWLLGCSAGWLAGWLAGLLPGRLAGKSWGVDSQMAPGPLWKLGRGDASSIRPPGHARKAETARCKGPGVCQFAQLIGGANLRSLLWRPERIGSSPTSDILGCTICPASCPSLLHLLREGWGGKCGDLLGSSPSCPGCVPAEYFPRTAWPSGWLR
jgi:hypothetical protein